MKDSEIDNSTKKSIMAVVTLACLTMLLIGTPVRGQQPDTSKVEIGPQFSSLTLVEPAVKREVGVGARVTFNLTENLALDSDFNYFPSGSTRGFTPGGSIFQGQFGIKAGKRWQRFGVFAKARPGFVSFDGDFAPRVTGSTTINGMQFPVFDLDRIVRSTHFSMDLGGVIEVYPSRRVIVRFDAGDTIIRYGPRDALDFAHTPPFFRVPARTTNNFQFSSGVSFRLMMPKDETAATNSRNDSAANETTPRYEIGAQITTLTFNPPRQIFGSPVIAGESRPQTELGFGGRFTFNLIDSIALESVINYFPAADGVAAGATGRVLQGQFGLKAGKRFGRFGFFGKARPGFVSFPRSIKLVGTEPFTFSGFTFIRGIFETGRRTFFANDFGGVIEFYSARRFSLRIDAGDTIIHYGARSIPTVFLNPAFITAPPEKRHNFQFSSGFGFRF